MLVATCLSRQIFVAKKIFCRDKYNFVAASIRLSRQTCVYRDKHVFVVTEHCRDKIDTCGSSRQRYYVHYPLTVLPVG